MKKQTKFQKQITTLAKAMLQGCKKTLPTKDSYLFVDDDADGSVYACALGAALVNGFSVKSSLKLANELGGYLAVIKRQPVLAVEDEEHAALVDEIIERNDSLGHTRQRIAKWLLRVAKFPTPPIAWSNVK